MLAIRDVRPGANDAIFVAPATIQSSLAVAGPWTTLTNLPAGDAGRFDFEDPTGGVMSRFYRCVYP